MYAYVAFLVVLLTYGMETTYFRYANDPTEQEPKVFSNILSSVAFSSLLFIVIAYVFRQPIAQALDRPNHAEFIVWLSMIVSIDAVSAIPLAKLRKEGRLGLFNAINLGNIGINILLNLFFLAYCAPMYKAGNSNALIDFCYNPEWGVSYVFIANLVASIVKCLMSVWWVKFKYYALDLNLWKKCLKYGFPLLLVGLAGMINETLDRILLKNILLPSKGLLETDKIVGIYGACYKLSIIITLFIQAFRYAAEPFFFAEKKGPEVFARVMNYFVMFCAFILLGVLLFLDQAKYFIPNPAYWDGLVIVPVLLYANVFLGIYFNLSAWYKLTDKTSLGAVISFVGAAITILLNLWLIPYFTYLGAAWTTFICYFSMMVLSFFWGQKHFPVPYELKKLAAFLLLPLILWGLSSWLKLHIAVFGMIFANISLMVVYLWIVLKIEGRSLSQIPKLLLNLRK